jgi:uncharacterized iron-regulated membrane protein
MKLLTISTFSKLVLFVFLVSGLTLILNDYKGLIFYFLTVVKKRERFEVMALHFSRFF